MKKLITFALCIWSLYLTGCTPKDNPSSSEVKGNITGTILLYDASYNQLDLADSVKVEIEGTSFSTMTDKSGEWTLKDVPAGIYSLAITKSDFGTMKYPAYQFVGNGTAIFSTVSLLHTPDFTVTLASVSLKDSSKKYFVYRDSVVYRDSMLVYVDSAGRHDTTITRIPETIHVGLDTVVDPFGAPSIFGSVSQNPKKGWRAPAVLYYTKNSSVTPTDPSTFLYGETVFTDYGGTGIYSYLQLPVLRKAGARKGDNITIIAYPTNPGAPYYGLTYYDVGVHNKIFTALGKASNSISFTMP